MEGPQEEAILMANSNITVDMSWAWIRQQPPHGGHCSNCSTILPYQCNVLQLSTKAGPKAGKGTTSDSDPLCDQCKDQVNQALADLRGGIPGATLPHFPKA